MKKKQAAPMGANPLRDFIKTLPGEARILGAKCYRSSEQSAIYVCYYWDGKKVNASLSWEGGPL